MIEIDEARAKEAINKVASTKDGQILLYVLMNHCNIQKSIYSTEPHETHANAKVQGAYWHLRAFIDSTHLKKIEFDYMKKAKTDGKPSSSIRDTPSSKRTIKRTDKRKST